MADRGRRTPINIRMTPEGIAALQEIADQEYEGNRSLALRELLKAGMVEHARRQASKARGR